MASGPVAPGASGYAAPAAGSCRRASHARKADRPGYEAAGPSCSSMRMSWLYFATRSLRDGAPVLIWPAPGRDREVGDEGVLGLARAVGHHRRVARAARQVHGGEGLGEGADLVQLDQQRVPGPQRDAAPQALGVGDEEVVADELHAVAERARSARPSRPSPPRPSRPRSRRSGSGRPGRPSTRPSRRRRACGPRPRGGRRRRGRARWWPGRAPARPPRRARSRRRRSPP